MNMSLSAELFILIYAIITLGTLTWFGLFLMKHNKNHFNQKIGLEKKISKMEDFVSKKNLDPDNPYDILGVSRHATRMEVLRAYKRKLKQYHPDMVSHRGDEWSEIAQEKTLKIQWAKEQILNHLKAA